MLSRCLHQVMADAWERGGRWWRVKIKGKKLIGEMCILFNHYLMIDFWHKKACVKEKSVWKMPAEMRKKSINPNLIGFFYSHFKCRKMMVKKIPVTTFLKCFCTIFSKWSLSDTYDQALRKSSDYLEQSRIDVRGGSVRAGSCRRTKRSNNLVFDHTVVFWRLFHKTASDCQLLLQVAKKRYTRLKRGKEEMTMKSDIKIFR